jgi:hypothetical protein
MSFILSFPPGICFQFCEVKKWPQMSEKKSNLVNIAILLNVKKLKLH